jgi:hypothetical protein
MKTSITNQKFTCNIKVAFTFLVLQTFFATNVYALKLTLNGQPTASTDINDPVLNIDSINTNIVYAYSADYRPIMTNTLEPFLCIGPNQGITPTPGSAGAPQVNFMDIQNIPEKVYGIVDVLSATYDFNLSANYNPADRVFNIQTKSNSQCVVTGFAKEENPTPGNPHIFSNSFEDGVIGPPEQFSDINITLLESNSTNVLPNNLILSNNFDFSYRYEVKNIGDGPITFDIADYFSIANNSTIWTCESSPGADLATICGNDAASPQFNFGTTDDYNGALYLKDAHIENTDESIIITVTRNPNITVDNTTVEILASALSTNLIDQFNLNNSDTRSFIGNTNAAPQISSVNNQSMLEDDISGTGSLVFTVSDVETPAANLTVTASSSNQNIVSNANITIGGTGSNRNVTVIANADANTSSGPVTITLNVDDGAANTNTSFDIDITPINDAPTFTTVAIADFSAGTNGNQAVATFIQSVIFGPTADESNQALINKTISNVNDPNGVLSSSIILFTDLILPLSGQGGTVTFDVQVQDDGGNLNGGLDTSDPVSVSFTVLNTLPVISSVSDDSMNEDDISAAIAFTISDAETASNSLVMTALSSDPLVIPVSGIQFSGAGGSRTVQVTPINNQNTFSGGPVTITLIVDDGSDTVQSTFDITINPINDAPSFNLSSNISWPAAESGLKLLAGFANTFVLGPTVDETSLQSVEQFNTVLVTGAPIFGAGGDPVIDVNGSLAYVLDGSSGVATITISLQDDGGLVDGGVDTSATQSFTITVQ